ncbi:FAD-binding oxidoreductase [Massilia sp. PWRC2]|uniref:FAD-binding oxidoreductase n=1 Tax=Massilia sp. PWRC2 TaxID=2804626 RepID=UPI003CEBDC36
MSIEGGRHASLGATARAAFLARCRAIAGDAQVLSGADCAPYLTDWRGRFTGAALAVLRPATTDQVAALVRACGDAGVPMVPQGGRTGLVQGSVPDASGDAVVLSLARMQRIRQLDPVNRTMTVDAGCILHDVQQAAAASACLFPLSLAAEGSCSIGGNLSTNAGGTAVLRYGNARALCLGLEVVTAQGDVWDGLRGLRKDNTGYDLRDLFIGAEGTLGIITGAVLQLFPRPKATLTALVALASPSAATTLLLLAQDSCGASLTGFELMSHYCLQLVQQQFPALPRPIKQEHPYYVLLEVASSESEAHAAHLLERTLATAFEDGVAQDAVLSSTLAQAQGLWDIREHIPLAQARAGHNIKHDIALPVSAIAGFIARTDAALAQHFAGCQVVCFGHLGDGNLHYNVAAPAGMHDADFLASQDAVNAVVYASVAEDGGSISAEHGIGALKRDALVRHKSAVELALMRSVKQALDPRNLMNPGKVL